MAKTNSIAAVCRDLAEPFAAQLGLTIWDVRFVKEGADWYLRVFIDKDGGVSINDCVDMTHLISPALDKADPIEQSYCLEVSSPGIERELTRPEHFEAYQNRPVYVRLFRAVDGQKEFAGILTNWQDAFSLTSEEGKELVFDKKEVASVHAIDEDPDATYEEE